MKRTNENAVVTYFELYSDGSGAPAIIECQGHRFQADFLGEGRLTYLGSAKPSRRVIEAVCLAYKSALFSKVVDDRWFELNQAMYQK